MKIIFHDQRASSCSVDDLLKSTWIGSLNFRPPRFFYLACLPKSKMVPSSARCIPERRHIASQYPKRGFIPMRPK